MKIIRSLLVFVFSFLIVASCKNDFLDRKNVNDVNSQSFYSNLDEAVRAVNSVYAGLQRGGLYQHIYQLGLDCISDENSPTAKTVGAGAMNEMLAYTFNASTDHVLQIWSDSYITIARANIVLQNVTDKLGTSDAEKLRIQRVLAEARFIRALCYLNLVVNYGNIPLRTEKNLQETQLAPAKPEEVYALIEEDFKFAAATLPKKADWGAGNLGRATNGAAKSLLGKAYLYQKKYAQCYQILKEVINSNEYRLLNERRWLHDGQHEWNDESIFEVNFTSGLNGGGGAWAVDQNTGWGGNAEGGFRPKQYGTSGKEEHAFYNAVPSAALVNSFEPNDPRLEIWFFGPKSKIYLPATSADYTPDNSYAPLFALKGYAWKKYQLEDLRPLGGSEPDDGGINHVVIRYADVLLMAAEALIEQNQNLGEAADYINQIRRKADPSGAILPDRPAGSQATLQTHLRHERRVEMCGEQQRRIDIVRWGIANTILGNKFVVGKHELLPIPRTELDANKEMQKAPNKY